MSRYEVLEDQEIAVVIDALAETRRRLRAAGVATPNLDAALEKFTSLIGPDVPRLHLMVSRLAGMTDREAVILAVTLEDGGGEWTQPADLDLERALTEEAIEETEARPEVVATWVEGERL